MFCLLITVSFKLYLSGLCYQQPVPKTHIVFRFIYLTKNTKENSLTAIKIVFWIKLVISRELLGKSVAHVSMVRSV